MTYGRRLDCVDDIRPVWLVEKDACKHVNRSRWTLRDWRLEGLLTVQKLNGAYRYQSRSLDLALKFKDRCHREAVTGKRIRKLTTAV